MVQEKRRRRIKKVLSLLYCTPLLGGKRKRLRPDCGTASGMVWFNVVGRRKKEMEAVFTSAFGGKGTRTRQTRPKRTLKCFHT